MFFDRISIRIALWYALAFIASSVALFLLNSYMFVSSLKSKDEDLLRGKIREYSIIYEKDNLAGFRKNLEDARFSDGQRFIVRLSDEKGKTIFSHIPSEIANHSKAVTASYIEETLEKNYLNGPWFSIAGDEYGDDIEFVFSKLSTGQVLQIGKDTEDREEFLESFARSFFIGLIPIVALALLVGWLLSNRLLAPIRWLSNTVKSIQSGEKGARVPLRNNNDELRELGVLFNRMLDESTKLIEGMKNTLDNVAHDLRTPIMRLQTNIEDSLRSPSTIDEYRNALAECRENSESIIKLLDAIMDISEAETGILQLQQEPILVSQFIDSAVDLYGFVAEAKKINLVVVNPEDCLVVGDRVRLLQAVSNLLDNAIKYSPEGTTVTIKVSQTENLSVIEIIDEGIGVIPQDIPRIWDRLYRGDPSRSTRGLGLGLTLVRAIVNAHYGRVDAALNSDKGMIFRLELPKYSPK